MNAPTTYFPTLIVLDSTLNYSENPSIKSLRVKTVREKLFYTVASYRLGLEGEHRVETAKKPIDNRVYEVSDATKIGHHQMMTLLDLTVKSSLDYISSGTFDKDGCDKKVWPEKKKYIKVELGDDLMIDKTENTFIEFKMELINNYISPKKNDWWPLIFNEDEHDDDKEKNEVELYINNLVSEKLGDVYFSVKIEGDHKKSIDGERPEADKEWLNRLSSLMLGRLESFLTTKQWKDNSAAVSVVEY